MGRTLSDGLFAFFNIAGELQEHRALLRGLETRLRDLAEAIKLLALDQRHTRELEAAERQKLLLRLKRELSQIRRRVAPGRKRASEGETTMPRTGRIAAPDRRTI